MITHIKTIGFMGKDIDEDIGSKMIYTGENTAGKTKRSKAIILTILGFIPSPGKTIKIASDILNTLGNGQEMMTSITCGGESFERWFRRNKKGTVSQKFKRNGKTRAKASFLREFVKAGDPRIVDLDQFLGYSENSKIDALFELYPPDGDLSTLNNDIEDSKAEISRLNEEKSKADNTILTLIESKNDIELPAGSLAETQKNIKTLTADILKSRDDLKQIEIDEAKAKAVEDEKKNAKFEAAQTQAALDQKMKDNTSAFIPGGDDCPSPECFKAQDPGNQRIHDFAAGKDGPFQNHTHSNIINEDIQQKGVINYPAKSIQKIIDIMEKAGCNLCAAKMIAKVELKKYKAVSNE